MLLMSPPSTMSSSKRKTDHGAILASWQSRKGKQQRRSRRESRKDLGTLQSTNVHSHWILELFILHILDCSPGRCHISSSLISSSVKAAWNKDACYNSMLNLDAVHEAFSPYGLTFAQHMVMLTSFTAVWILGYRSKEATTWNNHKQKR